MCRGTGRYCYFPWYRIAALLLFLSPRLHDVAGLIGWQCASGMHCTGKPAAWTRTVVDQWSVAGLTLQAKPCSLQPERPATVR